MTTSKKEKAGIFCVGVALLFLLLGHPILYHGSSMSITIKVTDKERIVVRSGESTSSKYLVFTDGEVFENTDALTFAKWNSSDVQGKLQKGKTYNVKVAGWRIPFWSSYRNIIKVYGEVR